MVRWVRLGIGLGSAAGFVAAIVFATYDIVLRTHSCAPTGPCAPQEEPLLLLRPDFGTGLMVMLVVTICVVAVGLMVRFDGPHFRRPRRRIGTGGPSA